MKLPSLAAKQKRILDWTEFMEHGGIPDAHLRERTAAALTAFKEVIAKCWAEGVINAEDEARIVDLERTLELLNEEARLRVGGNTPLKKEATASL
jgi:hypothetical protein